MEKLIALVTGANRGIGFEVTRQLANRGYIVFLGSRNLKNGQAAVRELNFSPEQVIALELDVTSGTSVENAKSEIQKKFNHLDVIINNAAIHYDDWETVTTVDLNIVHEALETNTYGAIRIINTMLSLLLQSKHGRIVNVSSGAGSLATMSPDTPAYNLSKVALNALTKMYAEKLRPNDILVNSVCPGWTFTDMGKGGRPISEGAASVVWAVTIHDRGPTGGFFRDGKAIDW
ncbi:MAG: SDR family NAD(P)-dependent oxidoreductase [Bacteriovorax sp.]|nr:SDR family NAD(P)-dependent oxidoreductase [Bacteriovorax sp.]